MKRTTIFFLVGAAMLLAACSSDVEELNPIEDARTLHTATLRLNGTIEHFDAPATRATTADWDDGATIYIQYQTSNGMVDGTAVYNQSKDEWTEMYHYEITEDQFSRAVRIAAYFIEHAKAAYSRISAEAILSFCRRAVETIRRKNMRELNLRQLQRACSFLKDAAEVQAVLDKLEECGYLIIRDQDQRNRPGRPGNPVYAVNPLVFGEKLDALPAPEE